MCIRELQPRRISRVRHSQGRSHLGALAISAHPSAPRNPQIHRFLGPPSLGFPIRNQPRRNGPRTDWYRCRSHMFSSFFKLPNLPAASMMAFTALSWSSRILLGHTGFQIVFQIRPQVADDALELGICIIIPDGRYMNTLRLFPVYNGYTK